MRWSRRCIWEPWGATMLQIRALEVRYGKSRILHGIDMDMDRQSLAVVGRNGMGKTTLCHAIMGMASITAGSVKLAGTELVGLKPYRIARLGVALVPQGGVQTDLGGGLQDPAVGAGLSVGPDLWLAAPLLLAVAALFAWRFRQPRVTS